jgi:hypothetical protein
MHPIAAMCRVPGVSPGGYHARLKRPPPARGRADIELSARIAEIHRRSRQTYGAPRIHWPSGRRVRLATKLWWCSCGMGPCSPVMDSRAS